RISLLDRYQYSTYHILSRPFVHVNYATEVSMSVTPRTWLVLLLVVGTFLLTLPACAGPITSRDGTPAFYWAAAKGAYAAGDYARTLQNLDHLADTKNDYS